MPDPRNDGPDVLSRCLFIAALCFLFFALGVGLMHLGLPPAGFMEDVHKTALMTWRNVMNPPKGQILRATDIPATEAAARRMERLADPIVTGEEQSYLVSGGLRQYAELHPETGCLAVRMDRSGKVLHAYPYRPQEILAADAAESTPHEDSPGFRFDHRVYPVGVGEFPNGDLLVLFQGYGSFPYAQGVARVGQDGHPVWFRRDYSHHWPTMLPDGGAVIPAAKVRSARLTLELPGGRVETLDCDTGRPLEDVIRVIDGSGRVLREVSVLEALRNSRYRARLLYLSRQCDPVHLNHVEPVGPELARALAAPFGVREGDWLVSLRNLSAVAVIASDGGDVKLLRCGSFVEQHSVHQWRGGEVLLFDNMGGDGSLGPSRLLAVDLATGEERTIFPRPGTPEELRGLFSITAGDITLSPDKTRALVAFTTEGVGVEVDLATGRALTVFRNLHDISGIPDFSGTDKAALYSLYGLAYSGSATTTRGSTEQ